MKIVRSESSSDNFSVSQRSNDRRLAVFSMRILPSLPHSGKDLEVNNEGRFDFRKSQVK